MFSYQFFLNAYLLPVFTVIFLMYILGWPRFVIRIINSIWNIRFSKYNISIFGALSLNFLFFMMFNIYERQLELTKLEEEAQQSTQGHHDHFSFEAHKRRISLYERGIFLYLGFFVMTLVFVKFSDVYSKKFTLEDELYEVEKSVGVKDAKLKKDD